MGYRIAYLAVPEGDEAGLLGALRLVETGRTEDPPVTAWSATRIPTGMTLVYVNDAAPGLAAALAATASRSIGTVMAGSVDETAMVSEAGLFERGEEVWWASHDVAVAADHLAVRGPAPSVIGDLVRGAAARPREDVDETFEVPVRLFESLTGFRYGHDTAAPFRVLRCIVRRMVLAAPLSSKQAVLDALGLRETVCRADFLTKAWWSTETSKGLWVLTSMDSDKRLLDEATRLAKDGVTNHVCAANELNLFSFFALNHASDEFSFELRHRGRDGADAMTTRGDVPGKFRTWIREARDETARAPDVHFLWQVPLDVFEAETGHALRSPGSSAVVVEPT